MKHHRSLHLAELKLRLNTHSGFTHTLFNTTLNIFYSTTLGTHSIVLPWTHTLKYYPEHTLQYYPGKNTAEGSRQTMSRYKTPFFKEMLVSLKKVLLTHILTTLQRLVCLFG